MKRILILLLLLPFFANSQVWINGQIQKLSTSDSLRYFQGSNAIPLAKYSDLPVVPPGITDSLLKKANRDMSNVASGAIDTSKINGLSLNFIRNQNSVEQVANIRTIGNIAVGSNNLLISKPSVYGDNQFYGSLFGIGNRSYSWYNFAAGAANWVDGKISGAVGNVNISSGNDSFSAGNRTVTGRRMYPVLSFGVDDPGLGIGNRAYVIVDKNEGDITGYFPNETRDGDTDYINSTYRVGYTITNGRVQNPDVPGSTWEMPPYLMLRGLNSEVDISLWKVLKADYDSDDGTKIYYDTTANAYTNIGYVYGSYAPIVLTYNQYQGNSQHTTGVFTQATGYGASANGTFTRAWNDNTSANGYYTRAYGLGSMSTGHHTIASSHSMISGGRYNTGGGSKDTWVATDPLLQLGNGLNDSTRNNAFEVLKDGTTISNKFKVVGSNSKQFLKGDGSVTNFVTSDGATVSAKNSGTESSGYQLNAITMGFDSVAGKGWISSANGSGRTPLALNLGSTVEVGGLSSTGSISGTAIAGTSAAITGGTIFSRNSGTESSGYQLNAITLGYDQTAQKGWISAGNASGRTTLAIAPGATAEFNGFRLTTGANTGYVLKSDASGNGTWQSLASGMSYKGTWDASTNTPTLSDGVGSNGDMYAVSTGGTQFGRTFVAGGFAIYNGSIWQPVGTSSSVTSVNSLTGSVQLIPTLSGDNIGITGGTSTIDISTATSVSNKLPLSGGTLTGGLNGTTISTTGSINSENTIYSNSNTTESSGFQLNSTTMGYSQTGSYGWITAGGSSGRTLLSINGNGGNVGIGTTSDSGYKLDVNGTGRFNGVLIATNLSGTNTGDNATNTTSNAYADAKVQNSLTASTTVAPSATAVNTALALKANLASPALTGSPTAPTQSSGDNSTKLATTAYVENAINIATESYKPIDVIYVDKNSNTDDTLYNKVIDGTYLATNGDRINFEFSGRFYGGDGNHLRVYFDATEVLLLQGISAGSRWAIRGYAIKSSSSSIRVFYFATVDNLYTSKTETVSISSTNIPITIIPEVDPGYNYISLESGYVDHRPSP